MTINHNVRIEIERVNGKFLAQVEVSGCGKCSRTRTTYETMEATLEGVAGHYLQGYAALEAYQRPAAVVAPEPTTEDLEMRRIVEPMSLEAGSVVKVYDAPALSPVKIDRRTKEGKRQFAAAR